MASQSSVAVKKRSSSVPVQEERKSQRERQQSSLSQYQVGDTSYLAVMAKEPQVKKWLKGKVQQGRYQGFGNFYAVEMTEEVRDQIPSNVQQFVIGLCAPPEGQKVVQAKIEELKGWKEKKVFKVLSEQEGENLLQGGLAQCISTRWVVTQKRPGECKARLVLRKFEDARVMDPESIDSNSPTVQSSTVKVFWWFMASQKWKVALADVRKAFLNAKVGSKGILVRPECRRRKSIRVRLVADSKGCIWFGR